MKKNYYSFLLRTNSRRWAFATIWGIHLIIENSFLRQKFWGIFFPGMHYWKKFVDLFYWWSLNAKCFLINLLLSRCDSINNIEIKMIALPEFLKSYNKVEIIFFCVWNTCDKDKNVDKKGVLWKVTSQDNLIMNS